MNLLHLKKNKTPPGDSDKPRKESRTGLMLNTLEHRKATPLSKKSKIWLKSIVKLLKLKKPILMSKSNTLKM